MVHSFDTEIAKEYGVNAAIIFQHLAFWIAKNQANDKHFYEGRYWTYSSVRAFEEMFDYLSAKQIRGALKKLENAKVIMVGNFNTMKYDQTRWYAFTEKGNSILQKVNFHLPKSTNGSTEKGKPIPDIITDISTDINTDSERETKKPKEKARVYGEYHHVKLTSSQYEKLVESYGEDIIKEYIIKVDEYCQQYGKSYKDYYLTIRNWLRKDGKGELTELAKTVQARRAERKDDEVPF